MINDHHTGDHKESNCAFISGSRCRLCHSIPDGFCHHKLCLIVNRKNLFSICMSSSVISKAHPVAGGELNLYWHIVFRIFKLIRCCFFFKTEAKWDL
jgi:hypothetical protein